MDKVSIRPANETDLDALCDLYLEFHEFHAHHIPSYLRSLGEPSQKEREELRRKILEVIQADSSIILVADFSGQTIGMAEVYLRQPDQINTAVVPTTYAHLQSLMVTEPLQRQGIGEHLLQAAQAWAYTKGASEMRLDIWEFRELSVGPLGFYEKMGYHTTRRTLAKKLYGGFMFDTTTEFGTRVTHRLQEEHIIWFTTLRADLTPQPTPVWFLWDGEGFLIYSQPKQQKLRNIARNSKVALNLDSDGQGGDIVVFWGEAIIDPYTPPADKIPDYIQKYQAGIARLGMSPEQFAGTYSVAIRVKPTHLRGH